MSRPSRRGRRCAGGFGQGTPGLAVVTGASSGIGEHLAHGLAERGHPLLLVARRVDRLEQVAEAIVSRFRVPVEILAADLSDPGERAVVAARLATEPVEVLCNNAGFTTCGEVVSNGAQREREELEVNAVAVHQLTLAALPGMCARDRGAILFTGSTAGEQPVPTAATYAATKSFVNTFAQALHVELKPTRVTCTLLAPGPVLTEFMHVAGVADLENRKWFGWASPQQVATEALAGLERGERMVIPGQMARMQAFTGRHIPRSVLFPLLKAGLLPWFRSARRKGAIAVGGSLR